MGEIQGKNRLVNVTHKLVILSTDQFPVNLHSYYATEDRGTVWVAFHQNRFGWHAIGDLEVRGRYATLAEAWAKLFEDKGEGDKR